MPAAFPIEVGASTDVGQGQSVNGDSHCAAVVSESADNPWKIDALLAVADSRSAVVDDAPVSELAVQALVRSFVSPEAGSAGYRRLGDRDLKLFLQVVTEYVNEVVYQAGNTPEGTHVGTTLTFAVVRGNRYFISHVGNSRAYLIREGRVRQLTRDHSWIAEQVRLKEIPESEAHLSPFRDRLTQAVGMRSTVEPDILTDTLREGDVLLLCSDGLVKRLNEEDIRRTLALSPSPQRACEQLVQTAKNRETDDNMTAVGARLGLVMKPLPAVAVEGRQTVPPEESPSEHLLNSLDRFLALLKRLRHTPALWVLLVISLIVVIIAMAAGVLSDIVQRQRPASQPSVQTGSHKPAGAMAQPSRPAPVTLKVIADEPQQGVRLHATAGRRVELERKGEDERGEQQGNDVFVAFRHFDSTRQLLLSGGGDLIVKQPERTVPAHRWDSPKYERFFKGDPLTLEVSPGESYWLLFQSRSGDVIRLCRFTVR